MDEDPDFTALLEEIPRLMRVRRFADTLDEARLFARLGEPLNAADMTLAHAYLDALGFPDAWPARLESWEDAADAALALDADTAAWEAEEMLRAGLTAQALEAVDEAALQAGVTLIAERIGAVARESVEEAAAYADLEDDSLLNAAVGAAAQAAHGAALVSLALDDEEETAAHPFWLRFRLFARGRWPIGLAGATFNVF
ncbi:MAG: hypothetical protein MI723_04890 [Caulobacterales bacterium]|nr:hypothetical protein [Caulobacterales bacterium]